MQTKQEQMKALIEKMRLETSIENIYVNKKGKKVNVGLVNQFKTNTFIPNKWFDWIDRSNAKIVIIGQDWGPDIFLKKYFEQYEKERNNSDFDYNKFLFSTFSSRTEKFIITTLEQTYQEKFMRPMDNEMWNKIFFTMSVLFTRQGRHFRGSDNFDEKISSQLSSPYLKQQLDIVRPKVIIPLGNLAFSSVNKYFNLGYEKQKISEVIKSLEPKGYIVSKDTIIIPNYHPAAHISPIVMKNIWRIVWDFV